MEMTKNQRKINWYRCPLPRETLAAFNQRSDFWGLLQTLGHLGLLAATGAGAWYAAEHLALPWLLLILFFHGTFYAFLLNGFHELCHSTVFKSKFLNYFFLRVFSFSRRVQPHPFLDQSRRAPQVHPTPPRRSRSGPAGPVAIRGFSQECHCKSVGLVRPL